MNFENKTVNFSTIAGEDKENLIKSCIEKQLNLAKFMAFIYDDSNILHDHAILMETVQGSEIHNILAWRLNGQIAFGDFSKIFIAVMDEYFK